MPYYGDPETLASAIVGLKSLGDLAARDEYIERINALAVPMLEGNLRAVYSYWPPADDTDQNAISALWLFKMTELMHRFRMSQNTAVVTPEIATWAAEQYKEMLGELKAGRVVVQGAKRPASLPKYSTRSTNPRFGAEQDVETKTIKEIFTRGIRV